MGLEEGAREKGGLVACGDEYGGGGGEAGVSVRGRVCWDAR